MRNKLKTRYGVTFVTPVGTVHSAADLDLYPAQRPTLETPEAKGASISVPGMNGRLYTKTWLTGSVVYDVRAGSLAFYAAGNEQQRNEIYSRVLYYLHEREVQIIVDEEPDVYWQGWAHVQEPQPGFAGDLIPITGEFEPYRREINAAGDGDWLWDPFNFETGVVRDYEDLTVSGTLYKPIYSSPLGGTPTITVTAVTSALTVEYGGTTWELSLGDNTPAGLVLPSNYEWATLIFAGAGTLSISYDVGRL